MGRELWPTDTARLGYLQKRAAGGAQPRNAGQTEGERLPPFGAQGSCIASDRMRCHKKRSGRWGCRPLGAWGDGGYCVARNSRDDSGRPPNQQPADFSQQPRTSFLPAVAADFGRTTILRATPKSVDRPRGSFCWNGSTAGAGERRKKAPVILRPPPAAEGFQLTRNSQPRFFGPPHRTGRSSE